MVVDGGGGGGGALTFFLTGEDDLLSGLEDAPRLGLEVEGPACLEALSLVVLGELVEGRCSSSW